jgi:hypothetical protein
MWNFSFTVVPIALGIALFFELNVLMSVVVGFLLFRAQYWFGESTGLTIVKEYPFAQHQVVGALLTYALLVVIFTRKYLWRVLKMAVKGERDGREAMSYRSALLLLLGCVVGVALWAGWADLPLPGMLGFFVFLLAVGFVATKIRAECGTGVVPNVSGQLNMIVISIAMLGGVAFLEPKGVMFVSLAAALIGSNMCLYHVAGLQLEMMEVGRRTSVRPRHIAYITAIGIVGGLVIGGWVYLSSLYSIGADNYPIRSGHFAYGQNFQQLNEQITAASAAMVDGAKESGEGGISGGTWAAIFAGGVTAALTILRQLFAGFWFHPVGFILAATPFVANMWGSMLMAWLVRLLVLRLGGAATVREKLMPFAVGFVLGALAAYAVAIGVNGYAYFFNNAGPRFMTEKLL